MKEYLQHVNSKIVPAALACLALFIFGGSSSALGQTNTFPTSGNVGIGTTSPANPLDVSTNQNAVVKLIGVNNSSTGASAQTAFSFFEGASEKAKFGVNGSGASGYAGGANAFQMWQFQNAPIVFGTTATERMRITGGGNVGIGTGSPGTPLTVAADANAMTFRAWRNGNFAGWGVIGMRFALNNSSGTVTDYAGVNGGIVTNTAGSEDGVLSLWTMKAGTLTEQARINQNGYLGIGTSTPLLLTGVTNKMVEIQGSTNPGLALTATNAGGRQFFLYSAQFNPGYFSIFDGTAGADRLTVNSAGSVGIGTNNPNTTLHVVTGAQTAEGLRVSGTDNHFLQIHGSSGAGAWNPIAQAGDASLIFTNNTQGSGGIVIAPWAGAASGLRINSQGFVGIGTATPTNALDVVGSISASDTIYAKYQDVAEWVEFSQALSAGTVVVLDHTKSNQVIASSKAYDTRVAGVISLQPGLALGENGAGKVLVATTGRVKVKVDATAGPIEIGDLLVTSDKEGVAKKSEPLSLGGVAIHRPGTLIGKALEPLEWGAGEILVLLSLQ